MAGTSTRSCRDAGRSRGIFLSEWVLSYGRVVSTSRRRTHLIAWLAGAAVGVVLGTAIGVLVGQPLVGIAVGVITGLITTFSMLRAANTPGVENAYGRPPEERRSGDTDYGPLGPGIYGAGAAGRDNGRT